MMGEMTRFCAATNSLSQPSGPPSGLAWVPGDLRATSVTAVLKCLWKSRCELTNG